MLFMSENKCQAAPDRISITTPRFGIMAAGTSCTQAPTAVFLMSNNDKDAGSTAERETQSRVFTVIWTLI